MLARVSTEVNIFDRYLFSGLITTKDRPGTDVNYLQWFLNSLDRDLPKTATINLFACTGQKLANDSRGETAQPYTIDDIATALRGLDRWDRPGRLHLHLWDHLAGDRSPPSLRTRTCDQAPPSRLRSAEVLLRKVKLEKKFRYSFVPKGPSLTDLSDVEGAARKFGSHWVHLSKEDGFDPGGAISPTAFQCPPPAKPQPAKALS